jgi:hypothetical protein
VSTVEIILIAVVAVFGLLALGGFLAGRRRAAANEPHFIRELKRVNQDLAEAHAADNGWEPVRLHEAAKHAFTEQHGGDVVDVTLVQVIDPPGTDDDKAVFHILGADGQHTVTMGRHGDDWHLEDIAEV